jgi:hypothetical protein
MKLILCAALLTSLPLAATAELAGDWVGVVNFSQQSLHFVLHISGPDSSLKATHDSPDQNGYGMPVSSITFSGATLQFSIQPLGVTYSGDLNSTGAIVGTFTQRGSSLPLVLARAVIAPRPAPALTGAAGELRDGLYHHNESGVEFNLPAGWSVGQPAPAQGNPIYMTVLLDPEHRALFLSADMRKDEIHLETIQRSLSNALSMLIARRAGQTGAGAPHLAANYKIREGSEEHTIIGGQQALRAVGEYERNGRKITELLTWICTEHTHVFFFAQVPADKVPSLQPVLEQIIQSARIP